MDKPTDIQAARELRVVTIEGAQAVILPADVLVHLGVGSGGTIAMVVKNGEVLLRAHDSDFAEAMAAAEEIMDEDRDILAVLAKQMTTGDPRFLTVEVAMAVHDRQIAEHGGLAGVKDHGLLESALARAVNKHVYGETDRCALAAAYAFGIARNHPFADGNKRTAWVMARPFLRLNGVTIAFGTDEAIAAMLALASGQMGEQELADWFRGHIA